MAISRLYNFTPGTPIVSAQVDAEFDQLVAALNGNSDDVDVTIELDHAVNPPLTLNQTGSGPIAYFQNSGDTLSKINNDGTISVAVNAAATGYYKLGGQYQQSVATVGNVGAGEDDLHSYTIAANALSTNGDCLQIQGTGQILGAGNNKTLKFYFGTDLIFTLTVDPALTKTWGMNVDVMRINTTDAQVSVVLYDSLLTSLTGAVVLAVVDWTSPIIAKWTGEDADGTNDRIFMISSFVRKFPAA